jgi:dihydropteroate synthase
MQINPHYKDVLREIHDFFADRLALFPAAYRQIILDPGFGFGKTVEDNYRMLRNFSSFRSFGYPLLAGLSRKSMINRTLHVQPSRALNGTTVLNTVALMEGANILRVHDVKEAMEAVKLVKALKEP